MDFLIFTIAIMLIGMVGAAANEIGADSRDFSASTFHREATGIA